MSNCSPRDALASVIISAFLISGCASEPNTVIENQRITVLPESREYAESYETMIEEDIELAGAAVRQKRTVHALGELNKSQPDPISAEEIEVRLNKITHNLSKGETAPDSAKSKITELISRSQSKSTINAKSLYERQAWEKYCNEGKGLSPTHIRQLEIIGPEKIPSDLADECDPPTSSQ